MENPPPNNGQLRNLPILRILGIVIAILVVVGGIAALVNWNRTRRPAPATNSAANNNANTSAQTFDTRPATPLQDADKDGLTDDVEAQLKTNPTDSDTDHDGLTDFDEARLYRSDPLKADTNGDGIKDGEAVKRGLNPSGGRLFERKPPTT